LHCAAKATSRKWTTVKRSAARELYGNRNKKLKRARLRAYDAFLRLLILPRMHTHIRAMCANKLTEKTAFTTSYDREALDGESSVEKLSINQLDSTRFQSRKISRSISIIFKENENTLAFSILFSWYSGAIAMRKSAWY